MVTVCGNIAVNKKLLFARLLLEQPANSRALDSALVEGALHHLHGGYCLHLQDLASAFQVVEQVLPPSAGTLRNIFMRKGRSSVEIAELCDLENDDHSWLSSLLRAHAQLSVVTVIPVRTAADNDHAALIAVAGERDYRTQPDRRLVSRWLDHLQELVERHRALLYEC